MLRFNLAFFIFLAVQAQQGVEVDTCHAEEQADKSALLQRAVVVERDLETKLKVEEERGDEDQVEKEQDDEEQVDELDHEEQDEETELEFEEEQVDEDQLVKEHDDEDQDYEVQVDEELDHEGQDHEEQDGVTELEFEEEQVDDDIEVQDEEEENATIGKSEEPNCLTPTPSPLFEKLYTPTPKCPKGTLVPEKAVPQQTAWFYVYPGSVVKALARAASMV